MPRTRTWLLGAVTAGAAIAAIGGLLWKATAPDDLPSRTGSAGPSGLDAPADRAARVRVRRPTPEAAENPDHDAVGEEIPDRGAERAARLQAVRGELTSCLGPAGDPLEFEMMLVLDESGAVSAVKQSSASGEGPAACVERALLSQASFAPAPTPSIVPVAVHVGPAPP